MPPKGSKKDKITPVKFAKFFDEFEKLLEENTVLGEGENRVELPNNKSIIFTDAELVYLTNQRLEEKHRIEITTFEKWKQNFKDGKLDEVTENRFFGVYKRAILKCKESLFNSLLVTGNNWTRFAWIMERKFSETWGKPKEDEVPEEKPQQITISKTYLNEQNK